MSEFILKWHKLRKVKNSNIIAGLDPATYEMGRADRGLAKDVDLLSWCREYISAVAPFIVGIKPNAGYFNTPEKMFVLREILKFARELGLMTIMDSKIADIDSTTEAWIKNWKSFNFDAVTLAPYAGNIEQVIKHAHSQGLGAISMGLMSNPEYKIEANFKNEEGEKLWSLRVKRALEAGVDAIVLGATYTVHDSDFMDLLELTESRELLYLIPGIGAQGGNIKEFLASGIDPKRCMINSGRELIFPAGSDSTAEDQSCAAQKLRDEFNNFI